MRVTPPISGRQNPQVCLQCDGMPHRCGCQRFEHYGAVFVLPCRLELMADLLVSIEWCGAGCPRCSMKIAAIVVGCCKTADGCFETTVFFPPGSGESDAVAFRHLPN